MTNDPKQRCADVLARILADTYVLYLKTHNFHWNVEGEKFRALHEMFEGQYRDMWDALDELAERVRALGAYAPGTPAKFAALATIEANEEIPSADQMIRELIADHEAMADMLSKAIKSVQEEADEASAGMLADRQTAHEKQVWMMKAMTA